MLLPEDPANHWDLAIRTHQTNFPDVDHDIANISETDPRRYPHTNILWASPSCTKHSKAQGVRDRQRDQMPGADWKPMPKDAAERSRATMWDVIRFAEYHAYDAIVVENVVEVCEWVLYPAWLAALQQLGYRFREVFLNSMHAGHSNLDAAPQSRDRIAVVAWRRGVQQPPPGLHRVRPAWLRSAPCVPNRSMRIAHQRCGRRRHRGALRQNMLSVRPAERPCRPEPHRPGWR